jgi:hypothetical protein
LSWASTMSIEEDVMGLFFFIIFLLLVPDTSESKQSKYQQVFALPSNIPRPWAINNYFSVVKNEWILMMVTLSECVRLSLFTLWWTEADGEKKMLSNMQMCNSFAGLSLNLFFRVAPAWVARAKIKVQKQREVAFKREKSAINYAWKLQTMLRV